MSVLGDVLIVLGSTLLTIAALGLHRFADFYGRLHSASKGASAGFLLLALGASMHLGSLAARVQLLIAALLLVVSTPVGAHLLARSAYRSNEPAPANLSIDELAERRKGLR